MADEDKQSILSPEEEAEVARTFGADALPEGTAAQVIGADPKLASSPAPDLSANQTFFDTIQAGAAETRRQLESIPQAPLLPTPSEQPGTEDARVQVAAPGGEAAQADLVSDVDQINVPAAPVITPDVAPVAKQIGEATSADITKADRLANEAQLRQAENEVRVANELLRLAEGDEEVLAQADALKERMNPERFIQIMDEAIPEIRRREAKLQQDLDEIKGRETNPLRLFKNGGGVAAAMAVAATSFNQALLGDAGPNQALGFIQKALDADLRAQLSDKTAGIQASSAQQQLLNTLRGTLQDEVAVESKLREVHSELMQQAMAPVLAAKERLTNATKNAELQQKLVNQHLENQKAAKGQIKRKLFSSVTGGVIRRAVSQARQEATGGLPRTALAGQRRAAPALGGRETPAMRSFNRAKSEGVSDSEAQQIQRWVEESPGFEVSKAKKFLFELNNRTKGQGSRVDKALDTYRSLNEGAKTQKQLTNISREILKVAPGKGDMKFNFDGAGRITGVVAEALGSEAQAKLVELMQELTTTTTNSLSPAIPGVVQGETIARMSERDLLLKMQAAGGPAAQQPGESAQLIIRGSQIRGWLKATDSLLNQAERKAQSTLSSVGIKGPSFVRSSANTSAAAGKLNKRL